MMAELRSALVIPVRVAEPVVGEHRLAHDPSAARGAPAHVTILAPWLEAVRLTTADRDAAREVAAATPTFAFTLAEVARFENGPLYLRPEPALPFVSLTNAVVERWPDYPPYEGVFAEVVPHLTIAESPDDELADDVETQISPSLPLAARATELDLLVELADGTWVIADRYPLGAGAPS